MRADSAVNDPLGAPLAWGSQAIARLACPLAAPLTGQLTTVVEKNRTLFILLHCTPQVPSTIHLSDLKPYVFVYAHPGPEAFQVTNPDLSPPQLCAHAETRCSGASLPAARHR